MPDVKISLQRQIATANKFPNECPQCHKGIHIDDNNKLSDNDLTCPVRIPNLSGNRQLK